ncbi:MAG: hypothetical protein ABSG67_19600 [Thermoguttaceae bacterium]|jgi:hypothetical protein
MQSSQSSATIAFRALVMLAFIIGIPLVAFNGSSLPDRAKKMLEKAWPAIASAISTKTSSTLPEAPPYDVKSQNPLAVPGQTSIGMSNPPGQMTANNRPNLLPPQVLSGNSARLSQPASNIVPADYQTAVEPNINNKGYNSGQTDTNPFMTMQDRLRWLGATYYLLETWGNQRQFYRFYCQMSVGGNSSYTRYFEAINANPLEAMADVLRQVEGWRGGGDAVR